MKKRQILAFIGAIVATCLLVTGLQVFSPNSVGAQSGTILVSAAASLKEALEELKPLYKQTKPNVNVIYNFGSSGALQQQIENGAPADVFISAAKKQMDALQSKGLILNDTRRNLLTNKLVLIVPKNYSGITSFRHLTNSKVRKIAVGEPRSVPAGQYAEEVFRNLGISQQVKSKLVLGNNVRQVLSFVESGNADAGIVYATDAKISSLVKQVATAPANSHSPIIYPVAVLKSSKNAAAARDYVQFLSANRAGAVFQKYGFGRS
ncbi:molybdate ABC transporter substrate-binding protein [Allocoleopsis sp.]|uniref:molybdate ABC transporter substrate-binding protein n=1 Tax=Allocoleopsis sp. TaxID=3088169 RepID=UPI002FCEA334